MSPKILIADDEPDILDYLATHLESLGYRTLRARDGHEALARVAAEAPDLVLLDWLMPGLDGVEVCRRLKEDERTRLTPVIIVTALDSIESRIKGIEAGADDFLTKPVNERHLLARVRTALRQKDAVDRRLQDLERIGDHLARFVPEAVKRLVASDPSAQALAKRERDVSVLFVDLSGYTLLSELLEPTELNALIERYFSSFLDGIQEGGGDVNETAGDGFMAVFEDPDRGAHAARALDTGLDLLARVQRLNRESGPAPLMIHMGINSGRALVGATRFEGVRGARWTFTASGLVTIVAARLAAAAGPHQIFAGPETIGRAADRYEVRAAAVSSVGRLPDGVQAYQVLGPARPR